MTEHPMTSDLPDMTKLRESAQAGNIDAIETLRDIQDDNRYYELVNNMDDDEFTD